MAVVRSVSIGPLPSAIHGKRLGSRMWSTVFRTRPAAAGSLRSAVGECFAFASVFEVVFGDRRARQVAERHLGIRILAELATCLMRIQPHDR